MKVEYNEGDGALVSGKTNKPELWMPNPYEGWEFALFIRVTGIQVIA